MAVRLRVWSLLLISWGILSGAPGDVAGGMGVDPADLGLPLVDNVYNRNGIPGNGASAMCVACHTTAPLSGTTTHFTAHYSPPDGGNRTTSAADKSAKERTAAWTDSGRSSKYGQNIATAPSSDNTTTGELICESCHNIVSNVAGGNNLLESSLPGDSRPAQPNNLSSPTTTLCEGCHTHDSLSPIAGIAGHHPMTGDATSDGSTLSTTDTGFTRGYVDNVTEMGGVASGVRYPAANALPCLSCHGNGHAGYTGSGARIMRRGYAGAATPSPPSPGSAVTGRDASGIDRQRDIDPAGVVRLITNFTPLCDSCHKIDD